MLTDNHMNIILCQIFSSTIYILLFSFLLFNLLLKALKNYNLPLSKLQHGLCKPTRTQTNVSQKIKNIGARWIHILAKRGICYCLFTNAPESPVQTAN